MFVLALCIISIVGCIGLTWGTPRPRNQEWSAWASAARQRRRRSGWRRCRWWAIIAIAPVVIILSLAVLDAV